MRIKEQFKKSGYFWLPSTPDKKAPGTLSISDGGHIELEVIEWFGDGVEVSFNADLKPIIEEGKPIERIVGSIEEGKSVTLDGCHYKSVPPLLTAGVLKSLIYVRRAFIGDAYDESEPPLFNTLTFSVEGIDEWVGISGISAERPFEESPAISYQRPEDISINLDNGMRLLITFDGIPPRLPIIKEGKISQKTYFQLVSEEERELRKLKEFTSVAHKITNFLCFAIDKTVSLDSMEATADKDLSEGQIRRGPVNIYYPSPSYSEDEPKIDRHDMLFGFGKIQSDAQKKIKNWIGVYEETYPAFDLYFSAKRDEQRYLDEKFLTLTRGLEAYHKRKFDENRMDDAEFDELVENIVNQCPEEHRKWLNGVLKHANKVSLRKRLKDIIEPFKEVIGNGTKRGKLIGKIVDKRNGLTHANPDFNLKTADEVKDLAVLCFKTELIFQLLLLKATDFSLEDINSIAANCRQLQWKLNQQL